MGEKRTILLSTHILSEMEAVCGRVIIITSGRLQLDEKLSDLMTDMVIEVEAHGPAEQVGNVLRTTDGVERVTAQDLGRGQTGFEVLCRGHQDLREAISQRLAKNGWPLRRLDLRRRKLEDHFFDVMGEEDPLQGRRPAGGGNTSTDLLGAATSNGPG
jgi:ABC-2 type transport system ATP-binding protein